MDMLTKEELSDLMRTAGQTCVSLYMPTTRAGDNKTQERIRFKNLLRKALELQPVSGLRTVELRELLKPADTLLDDALFWQYQDKGLAVFFSREGMRTYRLPLSFDELVVVSEHFHIKPLLPLFAFAGHFYLLALGLHEIRLLHCTQQSVSRMDLGGAPTSIGQALHLEDSSLKHELGIHPGPPGVVGGRPSGYHGHGVGTDYKKPEILQFFQKLSDGVQGVLHEENAPLVMVGVEYLLPLYRQANSYSYLLEEGVPKNPDDLKDEDLHRQAWEIVMPKFARTLKEAENRYEQYAGSGSGLASDDVKDIVLASHEGRVDTLFVSLNDQQWGWFDPGESRVDLLDEPATGSEDLLDTAAVQTILNRGTVYALDPSEIPGGSPAAAIFRY